MVEPCALILMRQPRFPFIDGGSTQRALGQQVLVPVVRVLEIS